VEIVSVNVGRPREVEWRGETVRTSIYKEPVPGKVRARKLNLEGDEQSDLRVHGGEQKAVYVYPSEHYEFWRAELPGMDLPWGAFGENLSTRGLLEDEVRIGDRFRAGTAELIVTQPRMPCYKLGIRFGTPRIVRQFLRSGRTGFYVAVLKEGDISAGDTVERLGGEGGASVTEMAALYAKGEEG
jgi:MOSC domain-containing protein YiiM